MSPPTQETEFITAERVHTALTARIEKRLLIRIAHRIPRAIGPDHLTVLALVAQILAGVEYAFSGHDARFLCLVNGCLALNWLGDSLDGTLARIRNQQRPRYGFYVDHIADAIGAFALMTGLGCSGYLHWPVAAGMLVCFYALAIESYLATYAIGRFHLSHGLFGPTEIRILLIAGNVAAGTHAQALLGGRRFLLFDVGGAIAIAGMTAMFIVVTIRHTVLLYRRETL